MYGPNMPPAGGGGGGMDWMKMLQIANQVANRPQQPNMQMAQRPQIQPSQMGTGLLQNAAMLKQAREAWLQYVEEMTSQGMQPLPFPQWVQQQGSR